MQDPRDDNVAPASWSTLSLYRLHRLTIVAETYLEFTPDQRDSTPREVCRYHGPTCCAVNASHRAETQSLLNSS